MKKKMRINNEVCEFDLKKEGQTLIIALGDQEIRAQLLPTLTPGVVHLDIDGRQMRFPYAHGKGLLGEKDLLVETKFRKSAKHEEEGSLVSPMPGKILQVLVQKGDQVAAGESLIVMEAMKMEHTIKAVMAATVEKILYKEGDLVDGGVQLVELKDQA